jgi:hypothetical protein
MSHLQIPAEMHGERGLLVLIALKAKYEPKYRPNPGRPSGVARRST